MKEKLLEKAACAWRWFVGLFEPKRQVPTLPTGYQECRSAFIGMPGFGKFDENGKLVVVEPASPDFRFVDVKSTKSQSQQD